MPLTDFFSKALPVNLNTFDEIGHALDGLAAQRSLERRELEAVLNMVVKLSNDFVGVRILLVFL